MVWAVLFSWELAGCLFVFAARLRALPANGRSSMVRRRIGRRLIGQRRSRLRMARQPVALRHLVILVGSWILQLSKVVRSLSAFHYSALDFSSIIALICLLCYYHTERYDFVKRPLRRQLQRAGGQEPNSTTQLWRTISKDKEAVGDHVPGRNNY